MIMKRKTVILAAAFALTLSVLVGVTIAWLTDQTDKLVNTFTYGDIDIELTETTEDYKMIPGNTIEKDPEVTVEADSEACWLFVKVEESDNFDSFLEYTIASDWSLVSGQTNVYYYNGSDLDSMLSADKTLGVLEGNQVSVKNTVTKEMLNGDNFSEPTLSFTAYAVQKSNFTTAAAAWAEVSE